MTKKIPTAVLFFYIAFFIKQNNIFAQTRSKGNKFFKVFSIPYQNVKQHPYKIITYSSLVSGFILHSDEEIDEEYGFGHQDEAVFVMSVRLGEICDAIKMSHYTYGLASSAFFGRYILKDQKFFNTTKLVAKSMFYSGIITGLAKVTLGRSRPYKNRGTYDFNPFKFNTNASYWSMPSGHTSNAFAIMTVIAKQYDRWWIQIPAYTMAASVAFQRIDSRKHWLSDVFVGGTIGYLVGNSVVSQPRHKKRNFSFAPFFIPGRAGIVIHF